MANNGFKSIGIYARTHDRFRACSKARGITCVRLMEALLNVWESSSEKAKKAALANSFTIERTAEQEPVSAAPASAA